MKNIIRDVPIPLSGLSLGVLSIGVLLENNIVKLLCGTIGIIFISLLVLKIAIYPNLIKNDLKTPVLASVSGTFPMVLMVLSTYIIQINYSASFIIWIIALILHCSLIIYFTKNFMTCEKFNLSEVYASYLIVYVGIGMCTITSHFFSQQYLIGNLCFVFSTISLVFLIILISYRYIKLPKIKDPFKPLVCIYAAPFSLCICAYLQSTFPKFNSVLIFMLIATLILYIYSIAKFIEFRNLEFYPSFAAFTFPFVIAASSIKNINTYFQSSGFNIPILSSITQIEIIIAILIVSYILVRYFIFYMSVFYKK